MEDYDCVMRRSYTINTYDRELEVVPEPMDISFVGYYICLSYSTALEGDRISLHVAKICGCG